MKKIALAFALLIPAFACAEIAPPTPYATEMTGRDYSKLYCAGSFAGRGFEVTNSSVSLHDREVTWDRYNQTPYHTITTWWITDTRIGFYAESDSGSATGTIRLSRDGEIRLVRSKYIEKFANESGTQCVKVGHTVSRPLY